MTDSTRAYEPSDLGNARRLIDQQMGEVCFVPDLGWHIFSNRGRWVLDETGEMTRRMGKVTLGMLAEAFELPEEERKKANRHALSSQNVQRIRAALDLAAVDPRAVVTPRRLDSKPHLLSVGNGTLNLKTGQLGAASKADLLTLGTDVSFDAQASCPRWERFLQEVFDGDDELIAGVQRLVGYILTGHTTEHVLPVLYGDGANGKSVFVGVLEQLLGPLAMTAAFDTFLEGRGGNVDYDLARLRGARLVVAQESGRGRRLAEPVVKQVTGGDTITARHPYGRPFSYRPAFTAMLVTNHRPRTDATDEAIWRRLRLIPFVVSFRGREDRQLAATLTRELPGILAWGVRGAVQWHERGLDWPTAVTAATAAYRADEDPVAGFIEEECTIGPGTRSPVSDVRAAFEQWARDNGERALSKKAFTQALAGHGIHPVKGAQGRRYYEGIALTDVGGRWQEVAGDAESRLTRAQGGEVPQTPATNCHLPPRAEERPVALAEWARAWVADTPQAEARTA